MRVLFDHQIFSSQRFGGVSKYFAEIISRMPRECWTTTAWLSNNEYVRHHGLLRTIPFLPGREFRGKGRIMAELGKPWSAFRMKTGKYDVVHQTNFDTYLIPFIGRHPLVTTYHDVNFLTEHNYNARMKRLQEASLKRADAVVAISENTKRDMLKYFGIDPGKIQVIHHGIELPPVVTGPDVPLCDKPYILFVGKRHLFKNFNRFATAFSRIAGSYPDLHVVCTGSDFSHGEADMLTQLGIINRFKTVKANENELNNLYRHALFFIFPSLYEGFGMPILEAMVNRCPTLLADASCFPEIAGDAAEYFNAESVEEMSDAMTRMLDSADLRADLRDRGFQHASLFSWDKCARAHLDLYRSLI